MLEQSSLILKDIGEKGLLARLQQFCPPDVIGDDAAVITVKPGQSLVVTTDMLVDNVHFSDRTTSFEDAGWRAAAANLSDLAAMGASPLGITVALGLPGDTHVSSVEQLYQGISGCLQKYNTAIVGGDVCFSATITVSITAFGAVAPAQIIRRAGAQVGDAIVVTGVHGAARAGLELLMHPESCSNLSQESRQKLIQAHQRPQPRLDALPILWATLRSPLHVAGMDSSDGLADAVVQLCQISGVGAKIERDCIPIAPEVHSWASQHALEWALYGGEDFELVLCLPLVVASQFVKNLGQDAAIIGEVTSEKGVVRLIDRTGKNPAQILNLSRGFQHF